MPKLYSRGIHPGSPWYDYQEKDKGTPELTFVFKQDDFLYLVLKEVCIYYPCVAVSGNTQLPLKVKVQASSTQNELVPVGREIPTELFSSPSQNYTLGVLNEDAQAMRKIPLTFNIPCDKGDTIIIRVSGTPTRINVGCMISGRKYSRGESWR
jgi:hypothetical protein